MKPIRKSFALISVPAVALVGLSATFAPAAQADSFDLHLRNGNVALGVAVGAPPVRYIAAPPVSYVAPPVVVLPARNVGYWGWDGYRRVWVAPHYVQPRGYWDHRVDYRDPHRYYCRDDYRDYHGRDWHGHDYRR